jgi:hypothetical protein
MVGPAKQTGREIGERHGNDPILAIIWHLTDISFYARETYSVRLSDKDCIEIMEGIDRTHDADIGVNWDTIDIHVYEYLKQNYPNELLKHHERESKSI